jgi:Alginate export
MTRLTFLVAVIILLFSADVLSAVEIRQLILSTDDEEDSTDSNMVSFLKRGNLSGSARYRFESFSRDEPAFPHTALASTLRLTAGYETPSLYGFSAFGEFEGVYGMGLDSYNIPNVATQNKPGYPGINDPQGSELNQGWVRWKWDGDDLKARFTVGRQELMLNDGRFMSVSYWRQNHQSCDGAQMNLDLPQHFALTYDYIDRVHRTVGENASDGQPTMNSHLYDLRWKQADVVNVSAYGLLLDYTQPQYYANSTCTVGLRCEGPWKLDEDWAICYTAEYANQQDFGQNPNHVDADYWLGELGCSFKGHTVKGGVAWLGGHSVTDKLSTPLAQPFNGKTELFATNPSLGNSHGLEADYVTLTGPVPAVDGLSYNITVYDYQSANDRVHYGSELDVEIIWTVTPVSKNWNIGCRVSRYWADLLYGDALRFAVYTGYTF